MKCNDCGNEMKQLLTSWYCECEERKEILVKYTPSVLDYSTKIKYPNDTSYNLTMLPNGVVTRSLSTGKYLDPLKTCYQCLRPKTGGCKCP